MWFGPDGDDVGWLDAHLDRVRWIAEQVVGSSTRVLGLQAPELQPAWLDEFNAVLTEVDSAGPGLEVRTDTLIRVTLCYGWANVSAGPYLRVLTNLLTKAPDGPSVEAVMHRSRALHRHRPTLQDRVSEERGRLFREAGIDEWQRPATALEEPAALRLGKTAIPIRLVRADDVWACAAEVSAGDDASQLPFVEVVGRGLEPADIRLDWLEDVRPFAEERRRMLGELIARAGEPICETVVPARRAVYRALVEVCLRGSRSSGALVIGHNPVPKPSLTGGEYWPLRQAAVARLTPRWGRNEAYGRIASIADHVSELSVFCAWFDADAGLREKAIGDILAYTLDDEPVTSQAAQHAWEAVRGIRPPLVPPLASDQRDWGFEREQEEQLGHGVERGRWKWEWEKWARDQVNDAPAI